jgi:hypothetical protein
MQNKLSLMQPVQGSDRETNKYSTVVTLQTIMFLWQKVDKNEELCFL